MAIYKDKHLHLHIHAYAHTHIHKLNHHNLHTSISIYINAFTGLIATYIHVYTYTCIHKVNHHNFKHITSISAYIQVYLHTHNLQDKWKDIQKEKNIYQKRNLRVQEDILDGYIMTQIDTVCVSVCMYVCMFKDVSDGYITTQIVYIYTHTHIHTHTFVCV